MKHFLIAVSLLLALPPCFAEPAAFSGYLRARGQEVVDGQGQPFLIRGVGLGNWLLPEGYMWRFGPRGDRPRAIEKLTRDLLGAEEAEKFWSEFRQAYVTEKDIRRIAQLGFNCVRAPLNARLFLTEGETPVYREEGFQLLDNLVRWCHEAGIYVVIDMHGAPGGQTGQNIDDSIDDQPGLFIDPRNQDRLLELWVKIATRYEREPAVAAYDLLNEPLPERTGAAAKYKQQLEPLYRRLTRAIRVVDQHHLITLEGADWANEWSVFTERFDDNLLYQFHYYCWDRPAVLKDVQRYLEERKRLNAPIWVGETGEKDNIIYWGTTAYFEANRVGWGFWPWKKMETQNTPYSIKTPAGWDQVRAYSRDLANKPGPAVARAAFRELLNNIRLENCVFFPDVVNALFHRVPGKVEAENYGFEGARRSYAVKDTSQTSKYYRKSEPVLIEPVQDNGNGWRSEFAIRLQADEWTGYEITSLDARSDTAVVRVKTDNSPAELTLTLGEASQTLPVTSTKWMELEFRPVLLRAGTNRFELKAGRGAVVVDWVDFR